MRSQSHAYRLSEGGLIDRSRPFNFSFDGCVYQGFEGDTLASALLASGIRVVGRSFKYHRPRGVFSAGAEEANALVELGTGPYREPNTRATITELFDGLVARSQNRWPSLRFDLMAVNALAAPLIKAGFYYKTFMWPARFWEKVYEPLIRRSAGLGRAAEGGDPDAYEKTYGFCDVLVIGGGPAGLAAALSAGRPGARVILCDEDFLPGGRLNADRYEINGVAGSQWAAAAIAELQALPEVQILTRTAVFGVFDHGSFGAIERLGDHLLPDEKSGPRQRYWRIAAKRTVLAAGSIERPIVFSGNDRPGIMLAGAIRTYINRFGVVPGERAAVITTSDDGWRTATDLDRAGTEVVALVDLRPSLEKPLKGVLSRAPFPVYVGAKIVRARGGFGVRGLEIEDADGKSLTLPCDLIGISNGWNPTTHLACHLGGKARWDGERHVFLAAKPPKGMTVAGAAAGAFSLAEALASGTRAGREAAIDAGLAPSGSENWQADDEAKEVSPLWHLAGRKTMAFADFQNDVTFEDLELAHREGFRAPEHAKRYTTLGMATDQGKTSGLAGAGLLAILNGHDIAESGTTTFRPPYSPVAIGAIAGSHRGKDYRSTRLPPSHAWAAEQGAIFVEAGQWLRAQYFPKEGEDSWRDTVGREVRAVRSGAGVCDVSTLGKIEVQGTDATVFLERVYANPMASLSIGKCRYAIMLREDGFVMDDGTVARLGPTHYFLSTTTANAGRVMQHLEFCHQVLWPRLDVRLVSVTEEWAQYSVAGPKTRDVLKSVVDPGYNVENAAFPHLGVMPVTVGRGIPARLYRLSFSGELAYEIAVPASYGDAAVRALMAAGAPFGIVPYGTEALSTMRIEKGHVSGPELNGQTTARDLGLAKMMSSKKDYIGRAMAWRPALLDAERPILVGLRPLDRESRLRSGAHFIPAEHPPQAQYDEGYMTSVAFSPGLGHWIGLGFLRRGRERMGEHLNACDALRGENVPVEVCSPVFVDPEGTRLHG
jgi:methylglutamate dehydrogenase subunit C